MNLKEYLKQITPKYLLKSIKRHWKEKFKLVVMNEDTFQEKISFRLSMKNLFVYGVLLAVIVFFITALLIAFTPLKVYVPGYTTGVDYHKLKNLSVQTDSLARRDYQNELYINNIKRILSNGNFEDEMASKTSAKQELEEINDADFQENISESEQELRQEAQQLKTMSIHNKSIENNNRIYIKKILYATPVTGQIISKYNDESNQKGIDIKCQPETSVKAVLDGIVLFVGWDSDLGHTMIIQHANTIITQYKHCFKPLVEAGNYVQQGEPIAITDSKATNSYLHFEFWINGVALNPQDYINFE